MRPRGFATALALGLQAVACATGGPTNAFDDDGGAGVADAAPVDAAATPPAKDGGSADASPDAPSPAEAGTDGGTEAGIEAGASDAAVDAPPVVLPGCVCTQGCGACPNVAMVSAGAFRIDSMETTNLHYQAFLASNPTTAHLPAACTKNDFVPSDGWPPAPGQEGRPVVNVDWCDAAAYCRWVGKRLCGAIGGGSAAYGDYADAAKDQWYSACSGGGARGYPYGSAYARASCNGADKGIGAPLAPGQSPACVGGVSSLFDMSGNVWEWEDACQGAGPSDLCRIRGGSFANAGAALACGGDANLRRTDFAPSVGIRCCSL